MKLKTIQGLNLRDKRVLVRVDFNCPIKGGKILDDSRIKAVLPTIEYLVKQKAKVILISHLGDPPENKKSNIKNKKHKLKIKEQFSLKPVYKYLKLRIPNCKFINDCLGEKVGRAVEQMESGDVILLENLRFYPGEKENDKKFAKELASLADIYINDAFSVSHRAHASVSAITKFLPSYAGFLLEKEVETLSEILEKSKHPLIVLIGGAKISTKIKVIKNLARRADKILLGGALANTFFASQNYQIRDSLYEKEMISVAKQLVRRFKKKLILPIDVKIKQKIKDKKLKTPRTNSFGIIRGKQIKNVKIEELNGLADQNFQILDIGTETIKLFSNYLKSAKMIVWNGPMGLFEERPFDLGTKRIAKAILSNRGAKIVIGGGETVAALKQTRKLATRQPDNQFISTGGGAMLEFLEGKPLPGIRPLLKRDL